MDSLSPSPHTHDDKRKRWQTMVSGLIRQWWYNSQISLLITTKRTLTSMNSTWSRLRSSSKSGLSYERGFGVWPQARITVQFSLTMSISWHSASREELASEVQSSLRGLPCKFQPQPLSLLEVRLANVQKLCVCVCVHAHMHAHTQSVLSDFLWPPWTVAHQTPLSMGFFQARILERVAISFSRIDAFELWCWRRFLTVPRTARRSNQSILKEINPEYSLEGLMLKLQYFGHLMQRDDSLEKTLMLGKTAGRRSRQHRRWLNGITDSMDMSFSKLQETVKDREAWCVTFQWVTESDTS